MLFELYHIDYSDEFGDFIHRVYAGGEEAVNNWLRDKAEDGDYVVFVGGFKTNIEQREYSKEGGVVKGL